MIQSAPNCLFKASVSINLLLNQSVVRMSYNTGQELVYIEKYLDHWNKAWYGAR